MAKEFTTDEVLNLWAMIFGNNQIRELGKEKSTWFKKIFEALNNNEPGFLEFVLACELRYGEIIAKELIPTTSLLLIKFRRKIKENTNKSILEFLNAPEFDNYCKNVFNFIKEKEKNGNY